MIDMVFIVKDENGKLVTSEAVDLPGEARAAFNELLTNTREWFSEGDIEEIAASIVEQELGWPAPCSRTSGPSN